MNSTTIKEALTFAAKIRSNVSDEEAEAKVERLVDRLGLTECKDTFVGGFLKKGISGGERKRTSIGYELITDPSILLLDEPTSGLDSHTSLKIVKMLRKEAQRGTTILATIHQPSSSVFALFDRVIVLSEGYTIYSGPPLQVSSYFEKFGLSFSKYSNPADKLSIIASEPRSVLNSSVSIITLQQNCRET